MANAEVVNDAGERQPTVVDQQRILVGDLVIDLEKKCIHSHGRRPVALSRNELLVLEALGDNAGAFVAKSELLTDTLGLDANGDARILELYIGYLRKHLTSAGTAATIETAPDFGYRLRP